MKRKQQTTDNGTGIEQEIDFNAGLLIDFILKIFRN
jgi:hypothetical protein